jgi:feruloyl esterase
LLSGFKNDKVFDSARESSMPRRAVTIFMKRRYALTYGLLACAILDIITMASLFADPSVQTDNLALLKDLKIENGKIVDVVHETSESITAPDGQVHHNLKPRTILKIVLNPAKGSNINVEIWLPDAAAWNKRLVGLGNGGAAGHINSMGLAGLHGQGYAVATTDMGTGPTAAVGDGNPEVWKDFGFRATHLMTVVAKQVIKAYYGQEPELSYFMGGSTGGQQALQEAQRYPQDYDGIVAGIPAHCRTPLHAYFLWNYQILHKCPFTPSQEQNVIAAAEEYMAPREAPTVAGKFISDPRCTQDDIDAVIKLALQKDPTLTPAHADALRKLFDGPRHAITGERIFCGMPLGSQPFGMAEGNLYLFNWVFGANKDLMQIDFGKDIDTYTAALAPYLNAENPDLTPFFERGGKLLMDSGSADICVPYTATLDYYERVIEHFGSLDKVKSFFRFYIIPGMAHGGGPGINSMPNSFNLLVDWREKNVAPDMVMAKRVYPDKTEIDMPLYPYPTKAVWDAASNSFKPVDGPRGGVERVADHFRPPAAE